jgi:hypothetical protein
MKFHRFAGWSAILVGLLSLLYALFYLVIARQAEFLGTFGSWVILAISGIFSSAAYVGLYQRLKSSFDGLELWALALGILASFATLQHGIYRALLVRGLAVSDTATRDSIDTARRLFSQVDPAGLATFFVVGLVSFLFSWMILSSLENRLPSGLGYLGILNAILLVVLFFASSVGNQTLILISGGLTSVIAGPIWWIWLGLSLQKP